MADDTGPKPRAVCFAYPCKAESGIQPINLVKSYYEHGKKNTDQSWIEERLHLILPGLKGKNILDMKWKDVETFTLKQYPEGNQAEDKTMMKDDFNTLSKLQCIQFVRVESSVIEEAIYTRVQTIKGFLTCKPFHENEVKVLCLIGHGLSQSIAESLRCKETLPEFDGKICKDTFKCKICKDTSKSKCKICKFYSTMKSKVWKWQLDNCSGEERDGLGEGYTARSVCQEAKKGDIVAFAAGFITPEWLVEQLHKREENEKNSPNGITSYTLVLLVDACFSGRWIDRIRGELEKTKLQNTRLVVQTACDSEEVSYGDYFIPLWCELQGTASATPEVQQNDEIELKPLQTPQFFDSYESVGDVQAATGLKFFKSKEQFACIKRGFCCSVNSRKLSDIISNFGQANILSYKLKRHRNGTPMAFFLVTYNGCKYHLHIHFRNNKLSGVNIMNVEKINDRYTYEEIEGTYLQVDLKDVSDQDIEIFLAFCQTHVREHRYRYDRSVDWDKKDTWKMNNTEPPKVIRSRTAILELEDPSELMNLSLRAKLTRVLCDHKYNISIAICIIAIIVGVIIHHYY